jgi:hypothetical protein
VSEVFYQGIRDLRTGKIVALSRPLPLAEWPFKIAEPAGLLWRYGGYRKFKSLIEARQLYFRRADKLEDVKEGRFTEANRAGPSRLFARAFADLKLGDPAQILKIQESHRVRTFLSCWHKNPKENPRMWPAYTETPESIVIAVRTQNLLTEMAGRCQAFDVQYISEDEALPELHSLAVFAHKRREPFAFEQEFRLAYMLPMEESVYLDQAHDFGRTIPVNLANLLEEVRFHPRATAAFKALVQSDLAAAGLSVVARDSECPVT